MTRPEIAARAAGVLGRPADIVGRPGATFLHAANHPRLRAALPLLAILALGAVTRIWALDAFGFNSDEAVYAGQAASLAGDSVTSSLFPVFRAHPLLFQSTLSVVYLLGGGDVAARLLVALLGLATVAVVYHLGVLLYGRRVGTVAALILAVMPYHVVVSRLVLLDVPVVFLASTSLYFVARFCQRRDNRSLVIAAVLLGLTIVTKEMAVLLGFALGAFAVMFPVIRPARRQAVIALGIVVAITAVYPLSLMLSGRSSTGQNYLVWQLFRRPNHSLLFYAETVPPAMGLAVVVLAALGLWLLRRDGGWREGLLLCWALVPTAFFEIWPTKGYQYLLLAAPVLALLAARALIKIRLPVLRPHESLVRAGAVALVVLSLLVPCWQIIDPRPTTTFLAGSGGLPGGRETGNWIAANLPEGAQLMTIGPSMANVIRYYGHRTALGLSVSPNPLSRNPSYEPIDNPDHALKDGTIQYVVWDVYTADRSPFFSQRLLSYVTKYRGVVVHTETVTVRTEDGSEMEKPAMIVYEVQR